MKKQGIINSQLEACLVRLGHTQSIVICDAGLPIPKGKEVIDLALVAGIPSFVHVLDAVSKELAIESYVYAEEIELKNPDMFKKMTTILEGLPPLSVSHEKFKAESCSTEVFIRTGECSPYSNVILIGGVTF